MKKRTVQFVSPFSKKIILVIFLLSSFLVSSYKSIACSASFTYSIGPNGHYAFTSTSAGVGAGTFYSWNAGDGSGWQHAGTTFNHTYITNSSFNVRLAIYDSSLSCFDTSGATLVTVTNIVSPCILSASFTSSVGNYGIATMTSTSTGTNANTLYYWVTSDSNHRVQGTTTLVHQFAHPGGYLVWLITEDTGSAYCMDSVEEWVDVTSIDTAYCHIRTNFTYVLGSYGQVTFTSTSTGVVAGDSWIWNPGDTTTYGHTANSYTHTYAYNGTYTVSLAVYADTSGGCYDSINIPITITNACDMAANFTWAYDSAGQVKFTSTSLGTDASTIYKWTFGDSTATVSGDDTITHHFPFIGYYTVTLFDSNAIGGCNNSITKTIFIYNVDSLQARFIYIPADSIIPGQYQFISTSKGTDAFTYYKWTWGDSTPSDSGLGLTNIDHTYALAGPYAATLTIWYTVLPHRPIIHTNPRYDLSSYTITVNVTIPAGIETVADTKVYNVYPNPNNGSFNIAVNGLGNDKNAEIRISNMMGQVIYQSNTTISNGSSLNNISLPNTASGVYLLQVTTKDNTYTSRLAIQK